MRCSRFFLSGFLALNLKIYYSRIKINKFYEEGIGKISENARANYFARAKSEFARAKK
jgi:hypothetical protein